MAFSELLVTEIFHSLQGETSLTGVPFAFVRLTGCNLRCRYCDTSYAFKGGRKMRIEEILETIRPYQVQHVLLTGGEPLMQRQTPALVNRLSEAGYYVSIETHGEASIAAVAGKARIVMDIKTPSSGMCRGGFARNLPLLKPTDEIKFVIASPEDYHWAAEVIRSYQIPAREILFSPMVSAPGAPGPYASGETRELSPRWLAERILEDRLPVRLQIQLHKYIWGVERRGV